MKTGIVLESRGKRGIYVAGVLDVLYEHNIFPDGVIGTSAGAVNACSYVSKQYERNLRYNIRFAKEKNYCLCDTKYSIFAKCWSMGRKEKLLSRFSHEYALRMML